MCSHCPPGIHHTQARRVHASMHVRSWAARAAATSPIMRPGKPRSGEPIPAMGLPPDGIPGYLKPIPFNERDIAALMREMLRVNGPIVQRILYSTWTAQREALKYQEIRNALRDGEISQATLDAWRLEYARAVSDELGPIMARLAAQSGGIVVAGFVQSGGDARIYALFERGIQNYIQQHAAALAVDLEAEQVRAVRAILADLRERGITNPRAAARYLRPAIGLTEEAARAVARERAALEAIEGLSQAQIEHQIQNYVARLERIRADRIARTELAWAQNEGNQAAAQAGAESGMFSGVRKRLVPAPGSCSFCLAVATLQPEDGIPVEDTFPGLTKRVPNVLVPPLHPNCYCVVAYYFTL